VRLTLERPDAAPDVGAPDDPAAPAGERVAGPTRGRMALAMAAAVVAVFAGATLLVLAATGDSAACACSPDPTRDPGDGAKVLGPEPASVTVEVEHSAFRLPDVRVLEGTEVTFVLDNGDPIGHELIVGPPDVHERHEGGHEASHPPRPGEVSVGPGDVAVTTYTFDEPGEVEYACHLPGHYAYGMHGTVTVVPA
jgi:uncharacterized cupredoxin-like copper-binding protein